MNYGEILLIITASCGLTGVTAGLIMKIFLETGIKESIGNVYKKHLEDYKKEISKELERYKTNLKNTEIFFQKKFEARLELNKLIVDIFPHMHHPDMDWYDVCDTIAQEFNRLERDLNLYLAYHDAALPKEARELIQECISISATGKFNVSLDNVPSKENKAANTLYEKLNRCTVLLLKEIDAQMK